MGLESLEDTAGIGLDNQFGVFTWIFNCFFSSGLFHLLNSFFCGFCITVYKLFKIVHLLFGLIDGVLTLVQNFLFCNYVLVSRGLSFFQTAIAQIIISCRSAYEELRSLLISLIYVVYNLPAALFKLAEAMFMSIVQFSYNVLVVIYQSSIWTFNVLSKLPALATMLFNVLSHYFIHPSYLLLGKAYVILESLLGYTMMVVRPLLTLFNALYNILLLIITEIPKIPILLKEPLASVYKTMEMAVNSAYWLCGSFVDFIVMPFSLKNISHLVESICLLFKSIISLLTSPIYMVTGLGMQVANAIWIGLVELGNSLMETFTFLNKTPMWIALIILMASVIYVKGNFILPRLAALIKKLLSVINIRRNRLNQTASAVEERQMQPVENNENEPKKTALNLGQDPLSDDEPHICVVCQENQRNILIMPCRHLCLCEICIERLDGYKTGRGSCPMCRNQIRSTMKVYT